LGTLPAHAQPNITDSIHLNCKLGITNYDYTDTNLRFFIAYITPEGNMYVPAGRNKGTSQLPDYDAVITKYGKFLDTTIRWQKTFGGSKDDYIVKSLELHNGNLLLVIQTASTDGDLTGIAPGYGQQQWVVILDSATGNILQQDVLAGPNGASTSTIFESSTGSIYVLGETNSATGSFTHAAGNTPDAFLVKYNANLQKQWTIFSEERSIDGLKGLIEGITPGTLLITGTIETDTFSQFPQQPVVCPKHWLIDTNGNTIWSRYHYAQSGLFSGGVYSFVNPSGTGYLSVGVSGYIGPPQTYRNSTDSLQSPVPEYANNIMLMKLDASGSLLDCKSYGADWHPDPTRQSFFPPGVVNKLQACIYQGDLWFAYSQHAHFGDMGTVDTTGAPAGTTVFIGKADTNLVLRARTKIDTKGFDDCSMLIPTPTELWLKGSTRKYTLPEGTPLAMSCLADSAEGGWWYSLTNFPLALSNASTANSTLIVYPNPVSGNCKVLVPATLQGSKAMLKIYSSESKLLETIPISAGSKECTIASANYTAGVYYLQLVSGRKKYIGRVVVQ
jgi:hypothetical protein